MRTYRLPYGKFWVDFDLGPGLENGHCVEVLAPNYREPAANPLHEVEQAVSSASLPHCVGSSCAIAINDHTRPVPRPGGLPASNILISYASYST